MLTISVKNFGPIAEGSVDLKPLTIFVGPSNTGKSYMATAVYAVMRGFEGPYHWGFSINEINITPGEPVLHGNGPSGRKLTVRNNGRAAGDALIEWASQLNVDELGPQEVSWSNLSKELQAELEHSSQIMLSSLAQNVIEKISETYGEPDRFVRRNKILQDFRLKLRRSEPALNLEMRHSGLQNQWTTFDLYNSSVQQPYLGALLQGEVSTEPSEIAHRSAARLFLTLLDSAIEPLFVEIPPRSYYLPAARSGMVIGHKPLSAELIRRFSQIRPGGTRYITLPATATDFLSELVSLDRRMAIGREKQGLNSGIEFIERQVLSGKIDIDESAGLPFPDIVYQPENAEFTNEKFSLDQTSSMVSELAPLVLFLKYLVRPGDLAHPRGAGVAPAPSGAAAAGAGHRAAGERGSEGADHDAQRHHHQPGQQPAGTATGQSRN